MSQSSMLIIGAKGQLGLALQAQYPNAQTADIDELDITDEKSVDKYDWSGVEVILNAAAYTNVDGAETKEGRVSAWRVNALAVSHLARIASKHGMTLVHISTDYVFDGSKAPHLETESFSPLSVYGASKAAGDIAAAGTDRHYVIRTSWVIGDGANFVRTMIGLGAKGINPAVVSDQIGRLTFTDELARAIDYLLTNGKPFGTYNVTNDGQPTSWADITRRIFELANYKSKVTNTSTAEYFADKENSASRPLLSTMDLTKLHSTGFNSMDWDEGLANYIDEEAKK